MKKPKKKFLNLPEFPGGKEAFKAYIKANLRYPEQARAKGTEGVVHLVAEIKDTGNVGSVEVEKGIGDGCDEEAVRLIKNVQYGGVKNRGMRVKTKRKFRIEFKLPPEKRPSSIRYTIKKTVDGPKTTQKEKQSYSYKIKWP